MIPKQRKSFTKSVSHLNHSEVLVAEWRIHGLSHRTSSIQLNLSRYGLHLKRIEWKPKKRLCSHKVWLCFCDAPTSRNPTVFWVFASLQLRQIWSLTSCAGRMPFSLLWGFLKDLTLFSFISTPVEVWNFFSSLSSSQSFREQIKWRWKILLAQLLI